MIGSWLELAAFLGVHPLLGLALASGAAGAAWGAHVWRLRSRERHLTLLVDERTRLWQEEVTAHGKLRAQVGAKVPDTALAEGEPGTVSRVLVIGDLAERREAMKAAFDELGIAPAFADSHWAATVATRQADADGAPYDLILIDASMEGAEAADAH
jgi:hypothetical protein